MSSPIAGMLAVPMRTVRSSLRIPSCANSFVLGLYIMRPRSVFNGIGLSPSKTIPPLLTRIRFTLGAAKIPVMTNSSPKRSNFIHDRVPTCCVSMNRFMSYHIRENHFTILNHTKDFPSALDSFENAAFPPPTVIATATSANNMYTPIRIPLF